MIQPAVRPVNPAMAINACKTIALAISLLVSGLIAGCAPDPRPLSVAANVDLNRYAGRWYVIANIPYFAENGNVGSTFDIAFQPGDKLTDIYTAHPANFAGPAKSYIMTGYIVPESGNARWRESPFWPLYLSYLILYVDPDYQTALVGYPGRGYGWVLARKPVIDESTYQSLLGKMQDQGYDISQFRLVPQIPGQIGNPGFQ